MKLGKLFNVKNWTLQYALEHKKWRKIYLLPTITFAKNNPDQYYYSIWEKKWIMIEFCFIKITATFYLSKERSKDEGISND